METFNKITNINDKKEYLTEDAKLEKFLNYALSDDLDISDFEEKFFACINWFKNNKNLFN